MPAFDMLLNLAGLLIWLNWRSFPWASKESPSSTSGRGARHPSSPVRSNRIFFLLGLILLLLLRPLFYWQVGPSVDWLPTLYLVAIHLPFRSDYLSRMYAFSFLSFGQVLAAFYLCLLLLSAVSRHLSESSLFQLWVRRQLGWLDRLPVALKWMAPFLTGLTFWLIFGPLFIQAGLLAEWHSPAQLLRQAVVIGLSAYLSWKLFLVLWLLLHIVNSYVFLGNFGFWNYLNATARNLMKPLSRLPLSVGKADFTPVIAILLIIFLSELLTRMVVFLY